jgi:hemophore-related protein
MIKLLLTRVGVAVGSLALSLTAGAGVASADPDLGSAVNTTCTYPQFVAALNAQNPQYGSLFNSSPELQGQLQRFLAAPRDERQRLAQQAMSAPENQSPQNQQILSITQKAFDTCSNF